MMSDSYSCWGKDWDDWVKAEEQRQEEHRFDREEVEEETMNERCLRCGELLYSEAIKRYEGYCANCYPHKKDLDTINQLHERVKELEEWKRKAIRFLEMIKQRDYWNPDLYKSDYGELETLLKEVK